MSKKYRRITGLLMALVIAFLLSEPVAVQAGELNAKDMSETNTSAAKTQVLYIAKADVAPVALIEDLRMCNVTVNEDTLIELVASDGNNGAATLVITNVDGNTVNRDCLIAYDENGTVKQPRLNNTTRGETVYGDEFDPLNGNIIIVFAVRYNVVRDGTLPRYQPQYAQAILYNNTTTTINSQKVQYICRGYECSLPDFTNLTGSAGNYYTHTMEMNLTSPNRYYTATNAYPTNRVINTDDGAHYVRVQFKIGSTTYKHDYDLA